jgi:hypothetical protein
MLQPVPLAPLGARAKHWYADADVETAVASTNPTKIAPKKRIMIVLLVLRIEALRHVAFLSKPKFDFLGSVGRLGRASG